MSDRPIFVISDLHIGDQTATDNFSYGTDRPDQLDAFLTYVAEQNGELIICGDLLEFWQANLSAVIVKNLELLDRLADLKATYVLGNHDADLKGFIGTDVLAHPLFNSMSESFTRDIGGKTFKFMHGHEVDPFNAGDTPGWGRMLAIFAGICEEKNGSPMVGDVPVEKMLSRIGELGLFLLKWAANKWAKTKADKTPGGLKEATPAQNPDRAEKMLIAYAADQQDEGYDVAIVGHTHIPGRIGDWYFNTGSWSTSGNNFARIDPDGQAAVFNWTGGKAVANDTILQEPRHRSQCEKRYLTPFPLTPACHSS